METSALSVDIITGKLLHPTHPKLFGEPTREQLIELQKLLCTKTQHPSKSKNWAAAKNGHLTVMITHNEYRESAGETISLRK